MTKLQNLLLRRRRTSSYPEWKLGELKATTEGLSEARSTHNAQNQASLPTNTPQWAGVSDVKKGRSDKRCAHYSYNLTINFLTAGFNFNSHLMPCSVIGRTQRNRKVQCGEKRPNKTHLTCTLKRMRIFHTGYVIAHIPLEDAREQQRRKKVMLTSLDVLELSLCVISLLGQSAAL